MSRNLIIVRHAHRNKPFGRAADNGLSKKGRKQAKKIRDFFLSRFYSEAPTILSSPKLRCVETMAPLAKKLGVQVIPTPELMEQGDFAKKESENAFRTRTENFCHSILAMKKPLVILCSHGDWIPEALMFFTQLDLYLEKAGWVEFEVEHQKPKLKWLIQSW